MLTMGLTVGLGNQLFEYAMIRALAIRRDTQFQFKLMHGAKSDGLLSYNIKVVPFVEQLYGPIYSFNERTFAFDPEAQNVPDNSYLYGNWQTEKYFLDIADTIRQELTLKDAPRPEVESVAARLRNSNSCFIHIRRGDYLLPKNVEYHGSPGMEYYKAAISYVKERIPDAAFFVFSDDPQWCKENFPEYECISALEFSKYEDLYLMTQCKHGIGANSSFSWWGNWLGDYQGRICIFPLKWFNNAPLDTKDLIPSRWIKL